MYTPHHFRFRSDAGKIAFMKQNSFATMINIKDHIPIATQLPFVIDDSGDQLVLCAHMAKANEQVRYMENSTTLVIFSGPHAYISPAHYEKAENVPTWDYISVHAYGQAQMIQEEEAKAKMLEDMIRFYEADYLAQWESLPGKYRQGMMSGITGIRIGITELQGQQKLSQNRSQAEQQSIISHLSQSGLSTESAIADHIKKIIT